MNPENKQPTQDQLLSTPQNSQKPSVITGGVANQQPISVPKKPKSIGIAIIIFAVLGLLFFSALLPGKTLNMGFGSPYGTGSISTGGQAVSCMGDLGPVESVLVYSSKLGFPTTYSYQATPTIKTTCNGQEQTTGGGQISEFNFLAIAIDFAAVLILTFVLTKIIKLLRNK